MYRDEILEKSRKENKGKDFADLEAHKTGVNAAYGTLAIITLIVSMIYFLFYNVPYEPLFFAVFASQFALFLVKFIKLKKTSYIVYAIIYLCISLSFLGLWILRVVEHVF